VGPFLWLRLGPKWAPKCVPGAAALGAPSAPLGTGWTPAGPQMEASRKASLEAGQCRRPDGPHRLESGRQTHLRVCSRIDAHSGALGPHTWPICGPHMQWRAVSVAAGGVTVSLGRRVE